MLSDQTMAAVQRQVPRRLGRIAVNSTVG